jgi:4'-phosphopantetheinyl transferase
MGASQVIHRACAWLLDASALTDEALAPFAEWLDDSERQRLARFVRPSRRRQYLAGRALARQALGQLLGLAPRAVRLLERPGAAPLLVLPACEQVGFSISHSGSWVGCAVSGTSRVGFDLELIDATRDIDALAGQVFDAQQQVWLASRPPHTRVRDFYQLWSGAEARFKLGAPAESSFCLPHPELSVVLCCERELACQPDLHAAVLVL